MGVVESLNLLDQKVASAKARTFAEEEMGVSLQAADQEVLQEQVTLLQQEKENLEAELNKLKRSNELKQHRVEEKRQRAKDAVKELKESTVELEQVRAWEE
eukprot:TRINITY_DN4686_c0_g1_i1.p2 TRINITY_DN4686_c0_g1~~TRINITY_DN4686_c0_g1_i1.p2  ORF type:complete len:101 (+),score=37.55 TRINITY_DN4686_c0_g1_i1:400-702(+)